MSVEAIAWALRQPIKQSTAKFVLVVMANCADGKDFLAWPSTAYLAEATGQDRKTVMKNILLLREMGFIEDAGEREGKTKQVVVYRLKEPENGTVLDDSNGSEIGTVSNDGKSSENGTVKQSQNRDSFPSNSTNFPLKQYQFSRETGPKTGHGTVKETKGTVKPTSRDRAEVLRAEDLIADGVDDEQARDWLTLRKAKKLPLTPSAWKTVKDEGAKVGMNAAQTVAYAVGSNWAGFKASWFARDNQSAPPQQANRFAGAK